MSEHHAEHSAHPTHHHISAASSYWIVWIGLMILTAITVLAYYIPLWLHLSLGAGNIIIAMFIATTKASLVCLYFMHLKYDKKFNLLAFLSSLIFLGLFLTFTLLDINTRQDSLPFKTAPYYTGKELPMEGEVKSGEAAGATKAAETPGAGEKKEGAAAAAPATAPAAVSPPAKTPDTKPAKPAAKPAAKAAGATAKQ